jgi:multidrug efflux system membrane fusion protein
VPDSEGLKVFVLDSARVAHATPVTVGVRDGTEAEITSGLRGGETVVTYGAYGVTDSAKVLAPGADSAAGTRIPMGAAKP